MTPGEFLALTRLKGEVANSRIYRAMMEGANETFLTLHLADGKYHCPPYAHLGFITGDSGGTMIRLVFKLPVIIRGQRLQPVFEAIRARKAAHVYEFDAERFDPLEPAEPTVNRIEFEVDKVM